MVIRNTLSFCLFLSLSFSHLKNQSHNKHASNAYENVAIKSRARTAFVFRCTPTRDRLSVNDYFIITTSNNKMSYVLYRREKIEIEKKRKKLYIYIY